MKSQPKIIAYMKPQCGWSNGVRAILKKYQLEYEDRDIINNPNNYAEMVQKSGQPLQPTLDIGGLIVADVSGEELEAWLIKEGVVSSNAAPVDVPINSACTDEEHARQQQSGGWTPPISVEKS
jgi:monothiol glutaredoxin